MSDPLVQLLKRIRRAHKKLSADRSVYGAPARYLSAYRERKRLLPDIRQGLSDWILMFEQCAGASVEECEEILKEMSRSTLEQFEKSLKDIERRKRRR